MCPSLCHSVTMNFTYLETKKSKSSKQITSKINCVKIECLLINPESVVFTLIRLHT